MMDYEMIWKALEHLKVETKSLACLGCSHEQNCSIHGCAVICQTMELLQEQRQKLSAAYGSGAAAASGFFALLRENAPLLKSVAHE